MLHVEATEMKHVEMPTPDCPIIEEITRCKDCKHADSYYQCENVQFYNRPDDYCSRGEKKDGRD